MTKKTYEKPLLVKRGSFRKETAGLGRFLRDRGGWPAGRWIP